jgi:hypothetical protein
MRQSCIYPLTGSYDRLLAEGTPMLDIVMLILGVVFFVATIAYAHACGRL